MATVCMPQSVGQSCNNNGITCFTNDQCCSNICLDDYCCQIVGACINDDECCIHYNGTGGCNSNGTCGTCVPTNGTCSTTADCCAGFAGLGLTCTNNICTPVLYNMLYNIFLISTHSVGILDENVVSTLVAIFVNFIHTFAPNAELSYVNITVDQVAALGSITRDDIIALLDASAPYGLLPDASRSIDNITVGDVNHFFKDFFDVLISQPNITFSDVRGLDPNLITGLANTRISDVANIANNYIAAVAGTNNVTITELASTTGGDITANDLCSIAGIGDIANIGDFTLETVASSADLFANLFISTTSDNFCNDDNNDCCSGTNCKCCRSVLNDLTVCDTCPHPGD